VDVGVGVGVVRDARENVMRAHAVCVRARAGVRA
jgi:hypothetical protein